MWERNNPFKLEARYFLLGSCLEVHLWGPMVTLEGGWKELGTLFGAFQSYKARTCKAQYEPGKNNCSLASQKKILSVGRAATLKHAFHGRIKKMGNFWSNFRLAAKLKGKLRDAGMSAASTPE